MPRFFVTADQVCGDTITITGSDVNHIKNVLRMECGESLEVCDGIGNDYDCVISEMSKDAVTLSVSSSMASFAELDTKLYLFQVCQKLIRWN